MTQKTSWVGCHADLSAPNLLPVFSNGAPLAGKGLYVVTDESPLSVLLAKLDAVLATGMVSLVQCRRKHTKKPNLLFEARKLLALCQHYDVPFVVNDDMLLAAKLSCGVHLGQGDGSVKDARVLLGRDAIIGSTCHASLELAQEAQRMGVSYAAFGALHPSKTKPSAALVTLDVLRQASAGLAIPVCAIGGITPNDISSLQTSDVSLFAVVSSLFGAPSEPAHSIEFTERLAAWQRAL